MMIINGSPQAAGTGDMVGALNLADVASKQGALDNLTSGNVAKASGYTLGATGPDVGSTLSARAGAQGITIPGVPGTALAIAAFGTSDWTLRAKVNFTNAAGARETIFGGL